MYSSGFLQALGIVFISTLFNIYIRFNTVVFNIEPIVFACVYMMSTALVLSFYAAPGRFITSSVKNFNTWFYGLILIGTFSVDIYLVKYISGTEMSIFSRIAVPISMLLAFFIFKRKPVKSDLINIVTVTLSIIIILLIQDKKNMTQIIFLGALGALLQALAFMLPELHKQSVKAQVEGSFKDKARVVGFVTFITSIMFFSLAVILSLVKGVNANTSQVLYFIPDISRFNDLPTILSGMLFGFLLAPFTRYFQWSASYKIKTENVLTILAIIPFTTLIFEWLLSFNHNFTNNNLFTGYRGFVLIFVTILMALGAWVSAYLRLVTSVKSTKNKSLKDIIFESIKARSPEVAINNAYKDDYEIVFNTLAFTNDDLKKTSELLNIPQDTIVVLLNAKGSLSLTPEASLNLSRCYRHNVAITDSLTGLLNKEHFKKIVGSIIQKNQKGLILFIDLNKFKPINDTYGHNVGDFVLKTISTRLRDLFKHKSDIVSRFGGDEFVIYSKNESIKIDNIIKLIEEDIQFSALDKLNVGASIGALKISKYPNKSIDFLINVADNLMYETKKLR